MVHQEQRCLVDDDNRLGRRVGAGSQVVESRQQGVGGVVLQHFLYPHGSAGPSLQPLLLVHLGQKVARHVLDDTAADNVTQYIHRRTNAIPTEGNVSLPTLGGKRNHLMITAAPYKNQSMARIIVTNLASSPTASRTITIVTNPACGTYKHSKCILLPSHQKNNVLLSLPQQLQWRQP